MIAIHCATRLSKVNGRIGKPPTGPFKATRASLASITKFQRWLAEGYQKVSNLPHEHGSAFHNPKLSWFLIFLPE
jgi:hypothetical protein